MAIQDTERPSPAGAPDVLDAAFDQAARGSLHDAIVGQSPVGVGVFDDEVRYVRVNPALQRIVGLPAEAMLGRPIREVVPGPLGEFADTHLREVLRTGVPVIGAEVEGTLPGTGAQRSLLVSYFRLTAPDGTVLGAASIVSDVSERDRTRRALERANARLELLGRAAAVLNASLDLERTLAGLGRLVVPAFADHCIVDLVEPGASGTGGRVPLRRYALVHADGLTGEGGWSPVGQDVTYPPSHPVHATLASGDVTTVMIEPEGFDYTAVAPSRESAAFARAVGVRAALAVPLRARDRIVGVVSFAQSASGRSFGADDALLARQLADRAAVAIDNARLYGREQRRALTLQRSLLPRRLPRVPGLRAAARYLAGAAGTEVGGDWYDLVPLPAGRVALVIGDVMGRGIPAAARMGQVRAALRAYAVRDLPPGEVLTSADELVSGLEGDVIVTCVYAVLDPRDQRLVVANAGHVPPLLLTGAAGSAPRRQLPATGPPLGAGGREPYGETAVDLRDGEVLALYTDGLVETRQADLDAGIRQLAAALDPVPEDLESACDAVTALLGEAAHGDDAALLLVAPEPGTRPPAMRWELPADATAPSTARSLTARTLGSWREPAQTVEAAQLAASELVTNAVRHAGPGVVLQLSRHDDGVVVEVRDDRDAPPRWRRAAPDDESGRGLVLVAGLADAWGTRPVRDGGKVVWCRFDRRRPRRS